MDINYLLYFHRDVDDLPHGRKRRLQNLLGDVVPEDVDGVAKPLPVRVRGPDVRNGAWQVSDDGKT